MDNAQEKQDNKPNILEIMSKIREKVKQDIKEGQNVTMPFKPKEANLSGTSRKAGELVYSDDLRYLNMNYIVPQVPNLDHIVTHRSNIIGKIIVKVKRKILVFVWGLFGEYFKGEQEFRSHIVKYLNDTSKYIDSRDADNFWELIRKIDYDITKCLERIERIADDNMATLRSTEKQINNEISTSLKSLQGQITECKSALEKNNQEIKTIDSVYRGLESIIANSHKNITIPSADDKDISAWTHKQTDLNKTDYSYLLLENRFRGSEEEIKNRLKVYPPFFKSAIKPVLEIGPGRGELLELFKENKINAYGVDLDKAMIEVAMSKGLDVKLGDALKHMKTLEDKSLGGVIAVQVVEHLQRQELEEWILTCKQKVASGGRIIFETINPQSLLALSSNYFRDPTHIWPLHPDTLRYVMEFGGLEVEDVKYLSAVTGVLKEVQADEQMPARWHNTVELINHNVKQLNSLLYGYMDYCIIGKVK